MTDNQVEVHPGLSMVRSNGAPPNRGAAFELDRKPLVPEMKVIQRLFNLAVAAGEMAVARERVFNCG